ncbi:MAG: DUF3667 domain-containing protein [Saprospiraceae bacterium]
MKHKFFCLNCEHHFDEKDNFCPHCGQKRKTYLLAFKDILSQLLIAVFNFDNTFFKSVTLLAKPWKLTQHFIAGRRISYYHPARMFIVLLFLLFSVLTVFKKDLLTFNVGETLFFTEDEFILKDSVDQIAKELKFDSLATQKLYHTVFGSKRIPSDTLLFNPFIDMDDRDRLSSKLTIREVLNNNVDTILQKYTVTGFWNKITLKQSIKMYKNNHDFVSYFTKNILWVVPLSLMLLALFFMLLFLRHDYYFLEHATLLMHIHSAIFSGLIIGVIINAIIPNLNEVFLGIFLMIMSFLLPLISIKKYYGQSWLKTISKYILILAMYTILLVLGLIIILLGSAFLY